MKRSNSFSWFLWLQINSNKLSMLQSASKIVVSFHNHVLFFSFIGLELNLLNLESLLQENRNLKIQLDKSKETIMALSGEYSKTFMKSSKSKYLC